MNFREQILDLRKKALTLPQLSELLDEIELLEKNISGEDQKPLQLPYASPPKRPASVWKTTF